MFNAREDNKGCKFICHRAEFYSSEQPLGIRERVLVKHANISVKNFLGRRTIEDKENSRCDIELTNNR